MQNQGAEHTAPNLLCFVLPFCNLHYEKFADGTVKCIEDEIPFDLPKGWEWARLASLIEVFITGPFGSALHKSDYVTDGIPLINPMNITDGKVIPVDKMQVSPETVERLSSFKVTPGDIVIARRGDMGRCAVVQPEQEGWLCGTGSFILRFSAVLCPEYFAICLRSPYSVELMSGNSIGNTMLNLNQTILKSILIPVPPCTEQNRIINAIFDADTLLAEIADQSESLVICVAKTKAKILDLAIRGKLVPQDPNDEPASVLLERIRAEKEELIRQGKIKRDKKDSVIFKGEDNSYYEKINDTTICIDKEIPFEVPETWSWTRFRNIVLNYDSQRRPITKHNRVNDFGLYDYYGATGVIDTVDSYIFDGKYLMIGEDGGNFFTQRDNSFITNGRFWANNHVHIVKPVLCSIWYLKYFLDNCDLAIMGLITGIGVPKLNQENMNKILIPIPPIEEQKKIATIIKEIDSVSFDIEKILT